MEFVTPEVIQNLMSFELNSYSRKMISEINLSYEYLSDDEKNLAYVKCLDTIFSDIQSVGAHRHDVWQQGWKENLQLFLNDNSYKSLIPKYFDKQSDINAIVRWNGEFVSAQSPYFVYNIFCILVDTILQKFVDHNYDNLYEFGCGTGYNLVRFAKYNQNINLIGTDWVKSSQDLLTEIQKSGLSNNISGYNFNYFEIDDSISIKENSAILTCCSLEQIGESYKDIVDYWVSQKPKICINFENDNSILDENRLVDKLSILYAKKRKYLDGFVDYLKHLQSQNIIKIIYHKRFFTGNMYHESFPVIIWEVI